MAAVKKPEAKSPSVEAVKAAFAALEMKRTPEPKPLNAAQISKIATQRMRLAAKRGGTAAATRAIQLNAKDLGMEPKDYVKAFAAEIKACGLK